VLVSDGQTAAFHVGEKYPIPTAIYTGASQSSGLASLNNPIGQVNLEDLGLLIKVGAHVTGDQDVSLELEAESKALGTAIIDSVPSIAQRTFKGSVRLRPGEWAVLAGLNSDSVSNSRSGILGLSSIAGLNQVLSENTRSHIKSDLLIVIKPTITTLPMSNGISPQYLLGPQRGWRVIL
jgi:general secretion pathway protein D